MKLGTIFYNNKLYNLEFSKNSEIKNLLNLRKEDSKKYALLNRVYEYKATNEIVEYKVKNQLNSINSEINMVNNKFVESSKNYCLIQEEIQSVMNEYTKILKGICYKYDVKIEKTILKILKYENKLKKSKKEETILELQKEIKQLTKMNNKLSEDKIKDVMDAMETEGKKLSTKIRKPKNFKTITRFFANKFNTYNVIMKNILSPIKQRCDDYLNQNLSICDKETKEFNIYEFEKKL